MKLKKGYLEFWTHPDITYDEKVDISNIKIGKEAELSKIYNRIIGPFNDSFRFTNYRMVDCGEQTTEQDEREIRYRRSNDENIQILERKLVCRHLINNIKFTNSVSTRSYFLQNRPPGSESKVRGVASHKVVRRGSNGKKVKGLLGPRGRYYGFRHAGAGIVKPQDMLTLEELEFFIAILPLLGRGFSGFFNGAAPGDPNRLHAQYWKEPIPILDSEPHSWPIPFEREKLPDIPTTAEWLMTKWNENGKKCDFVFEYDSDCFVANCIPRHIIKPVNTLAGGHENQYDQHFGDFGVLEVSGVLVTFKTIEAFHEMMEHPNIYEEALVELAP